MVTPVAMCRAKLDIAFDDNLVIWSVAGSANGTDWTEIIARRTSSTADYNLPIGTGESAYRYWSLYYTYVHPGGYYAGVSLNAYELWQYAAGDAEAPAPELPGTVTVAAAAPTADDDADDGFVVGSRWIDTSTGAEYVLTDSTVGAAVWVETTGAGAPTTVDYLVGTASGALSAEIVVGTTPGGELGGTWASPTVDATHSGSTHAATQAAAEGTAAAALSGHTGDTADAHDASAISVLDTGALLHGDGRGSRTGRARRLDWQRRDRGDPHQRHAEHAARLRRPDPERGAGRPRVTSSERLPSRRFLPAY